MYIKEFEQTTCYMSTGSQMQNLIYNRTKKMIAEADLERAMVRTPDQLVQRREKMRKVFIDSIGGLPSFETPLNPQITGIIHCNGFRIEKIIFESRPKTYVTCNLYVPENISTPRAAVLFVCGHHLDAKHQTDEYQVVCRTLVEAGFVVFAHDPIGQGERLSFYEKRINDTTVGWGTTEHEYVGQQCLPLGYSIARYFLHDSMRALDYLVSRPEVDAERIGITGNSGGGLQTAMMMMADPRLAVAAPATFVMNRDLYMEAGSGQDAEQIWPGCTAMGLDHEDFIVCMAPKPVLILCVKYDFFPIEATRLTVDRCRRFYDMFGKEANLEIYEDTTTHLYTRKMARKAAAFFKKHLMDAPLCPNENKRIDDVQFIEPQLLYATRSGQVRVDFPEARAVTEENADAVQNINGKLLYIKKEAITWLSDRVFSGRLPCDLNPRFYNIKPTVFEDLLFFPMFWYSQDKVINHGYLFTPLDKQGRTLPVTIALWNGGTNSIADHYKFLKTECLKDRSVLVADTTGIGKLLPNPSAPNRDIDAYFSTKHTLADDLVWIDDSLPALRAYDVTRMVDMINQLDCFDATDISIFCEGIHGLCGLFAALVDPRIAHVQDETGFESYKHFVQSRYYDACDIKSAILPGIMRHFDLPELRTWIRQ